MLCVQLSVAYPMGGGGGGAHSVGLGRLSERQLEELAIALLEKDLDDGDDDDSASGACNHHAILIHAIL